jgi:hypothetical protein
MGSRVLLVQSASFELPTLKSQSQLEAPPLLCKVLGLMVDDDA